MFYFTLKNTQLPSIIWKSLVFIINGFFKICGIPIKTATNQVTTWYVLSGVNDIHSGLICIHKVVAFPPLSKVGINALTTNILYHW